MARLSSFVVVPFMTGFGSFFGVPSSFGGWLAVLIASLGSLLMVGSFFCLRVALSGRFAGLIGFVGVAGTPLTIFVDFFACLARIDLACPGDWGEAVFNFLGVGFSDESSAKCGRWCLFAAESGLG